MIDQNRLAETFRFLAETDSVSKDEARIFFELKKILESMGAEVVSDHAGAKIGSNANNLIARFKGNRNAPPLLLNAHMDTVGPGKGVKVLFKDGVFTSAGDTILGADDKSAIAVLLESIRVIQERNIPCGPLELVLTVCEEIGLMGAKHLDYSLITAKYGYALDATDTEFIITRAPGAKKIDIEVHGKEAHAGVAPEKGINAISIAAKAIAKLSLGRIDAETTCNIGVIEGGIATNIIPRLVRIKGEARSHSPEKLEAVTEEILSAFRQAVENEKKSPEDELPALKIHLEHDFNRTDIPEDHPVIVHARKAAENLGMRLVPKTTGGGADANIFVEKGIIVGVLGTGMRDMHTISESVSLADMSKTAELVIEIIRLHAAAA
ncbi:MAG: M20/M25/M40 family metallo-hydrolase [Desulfococcaceae bacterium]